MRDALVSWNHATVFELPSYSMYGGGGGSGLFEKTYDLGASPKSRTPHPVFKSPIHPDRALQTGRKLDAPLKAECCFTPMSSTPLYS